MERAGERVVCAQLQKLTLQLLARRDIDEHAMAEGLAGGGIADQKCGVEYGSDLTIGPADVELVVAYHAVPCQKLHFQRAATRVDDQIIHPSGRELVKGSNSEHREE